MGWKPYDLLHCSFADVLFALQGYSEKQNKESIDSTYMWREMYALVHNAFAKSPIKGSDVVKLPFDTHILAGNSFTHEELKEQFAKLKNIQNG